MRVGIVDVGANTVRLLVAGMRDRALVAVREERVQLGLGDEIERTGGIGKMKLEAAATAAARQARKARKLGCAAVEVLVTSPGRQARNGGELAHRLERATGAPTRVLTPTEEGELAFRGALASATDPPGSVAVCDVGGGSTQIAIGEPNGPPSWVESIGIGSLRLTGRAFRNDPPDAEDIARAAHILATEFAPIAPPQPLAAIAVGGTARALRRVVGAELSDESLLLAVRCLCGRSAKKNASEYRVDEARARTMMTGALIFLELRRRLATPLQVGRGGLREGATLALLAEAAAAARSA
jgi:exopolyphosphatase / guanosine-5'-triphosphate,3'-diphosphate pyrophosphatase